MSYLRAVKFKNLFCIIEKKEKYLPYWEKLILFWWFLDGLIQMNWVEQFHLKLKNWPLLQTCMIVTFNVEPIWFWWWVFLRVLDTNELSGTIPSQIGKLTSLMYLYDLLWTNLISSFWVFRYLYSNELSGTIPSQIGNLTPLLELYDCDI